MMNTRRGWILMLYKLMCKDRCVYTLDRDTLKATIECPELMPVNLGVIPGQELQCFQDWCATRVLPLDRKYAKRILNALGLPQSSTAAEKAKIALSYYAVSLQDCYWVCTDKSTKVWKDVSVFSNHLSDVIQLVALQGSSITIRNKNLQLGHELSTDGTYAKAWARQENGIVLYKAGEGNDEVCRECLASKILDFTNVDHVTYTKGNFEGTEVSISKCMTDENRSRVTYAALKQGLGQDALSKVIALDPENYYKMLVVTFLIGNIDLHDGNWGIFVNPDTGEWLNVHPLFDFNNAFDESFYYTDDGGNSLPDMEVKWNEEFEDYDYEFKNTLLSAAQDAMQRCDFRINQIPDEVFESKKLRDQFYHRCELLDIVFGLGNLSDVKGLNTFS